MSNIVEWSEFSNHESQRSNSGGIRNLRLVSGSEYRVRFVGNPLKFFKYFINNKSAICSNPDTCPFRAKYNLEPNMRFAINVLDRDEQNPANRLKILEVPPSVLKPVAAWARARKADPGGKSGCDFHIAVTGQKKTTRYTVTPLDVTSFTDEEKEYITANIYDLSKLFKSVPENEIEERLMGKGGGVGSPTTPAAPREVVVPTPVGAHKSAAGVDLPF